MSTAIRTIVFVLAAGCAQGGTGTGEPIDGPGGSPDAPRIDAPGNPGNDAPIQPVDAMTDATTVVDGPLPDGVPPGSLFCTTNADCTTAGECCFNFGGAIPQSFCVPGTVVFTVCFPSE